MLGSDFSRDIIQQHLLSKSEFIPFPTIEQKDHWNSIPNELKDFLILEGEKYLDFTWPQLTATMYLEFKRTGNRTKYEKPYRVRRRALTSLVLAECVENNGRFLNHILDGIWVICEETSWVTPSHIHMLPNNVSALPNAKYPFIDLFAAETANTLAWIYYLLQNSLPQSVTKRIKSEIEQRIFAPYLEREDFWWQGYIPGRRLNNWTPWIVSNCLSAFLFVESDPDRRLRAVEKSIYSIEQFLQTYHDDGGCDEGPGYWNKAGGSLFDTLELIYLATNGSINGYDHPLVKNIGAYIYKVHIHKQYYVNMGDNSHQMVIEGDLLYRYGKRIDDQQLKNLGITTIQGIGVQALTKMKFLSFLRVIPAIFNYSNIKNDSANILVLTDSWLDGVQLMTAYEKNDDVEGLYIACKGGHNDESHNHNDIGNFLLYADGEPVFIDVGVETYNAKTFSDERYTIWTMQSAYHNLPTINGYMQKNGKSFRATDVRQESSEEQCSITLNIREAYPDAAQITDAIRSCQLIRTDSTYVQLQDYFKLAKGENEVTLHFMTRHKPIYKENGKISLQYSEQYEIEMNYSSSPMEVSCEPIKLDDEKLLREWKQDELYRINLHSPIFSEEFLSKITFKKIKI